MPFVAAGSSLKPTVTGRGVTNPVRTAQLINFFGYQQGVLAHSFQAIAQEQPPTLTGGWANISSVVRPRSLDYTMVTDYPPITMDVPIRFENWGDYANPINSDLEGDLQKLWWMCGRGEIGPGNPHEGNPPIVKVAAYNDGKTEIPLIPPDVQGFEWVISNLAYDTGPLRMGQEMLNIRNLPFPVATRGRQDVVVSLTQWTPAPGFADHNRKPANANISKFTNPRYDCIRTMCQHYFNRSTYEDYQTVMQLQANAHLHIRNPGQSLKPNTKLWFPSSFTTEGGQ